VNKMQITGHLGKDPESRYTPDGKQVVTASVAVKARKKDAKPDWFRVVFYDKLAEIAIQYLKKGTHVFIEGRLDVRKYTGSDQTEKTAVEIVAREMEMLSSKQGGNESQPATVSAAPQGAPQGAPRKPALSEERFAPPDDDDIPFYYGHVG